MGNLWGSACKTPEETFEQAADKAKGFHVILRQAPNLVDAIVPLAPDHRASLRQILGEKASQELIEWKYFDTDFSKGRLRGICALKGDQIVGFIGMIPVKLRRLNEEMDNHWLCDWKIKDPIKLKGLGGAIARQALAEAGRLIAYGGSEVAKKRWPRHAARCDFEAGITLKKFLRLDGLVTQVERRFGLIPLPRHLRRLRTCIPKNVHYGIEVGVSADIPLHFQIGDNWAPYYSIDDLGWLLERCPLLRTVTLVPSGCSSRALVWHQPEKTHVCKAVVFAPQGSAEERKAIDAAVGYAFEIGAHTLTFNCSRLDRGRLHSLRSAGFVRGRDKTPIHFLDIDESTAPESLAGLSCLDADMANRFS